MTSSPRSKFSFLKKSNFFNQRAIFIGTDKLCVYDWQQGQVSLSVSFPISEWGREDFRHYLGEVKPLPTYIVIDNIEEEIRHETIPHVFRQSDRNALIKRKQARLFRGLNYSYAHYLGREKSGRRDDKFLFMAFSNDDVSFIAALLARQKTPLRGIISFPLLLQSYVKTLPELSDHALVITIESISGLRQTFFTKRELHISRLSRLPEDFQSEDYPGMIYSEIDRIQHYLHSLRLISNKTGLDVYFFVDRDLLKKLQTKTKLSPHIREHHIDIDKFLGISGRTAKSGPFCDRLLFQHLFLSNIKNHYASPYEMRYLKLQGMRYTMNTVSVLLIVFSLIYSGINIVNGLIHKQEIDIARQKIAVFETRYNDASQQLPDIPITSSEVQVGVETAKLLTNYRAMPTNMLLFISRGLERFPMIKLNDLDWTTTINYDKNEDEPQLAGNVVIEEISTEPQFKYYQMAILNARIEPFTGNYRRAIAMVDQFTERLQDYDEAYQVTVQSYPLDVSSEATLHGDSVSRNKEARFTLQIVIGIN